MSTIATLHTLVPNANVPLGYFDEDNIRFVQNKIKDVLKRKFVQDILFDRGSIIRLMQRALLDRIEAVPKMNQRAIMFGVNEFMNVQIQINKNLKLEAHYHQSQQLYDPTTETSHYDPQKTKLANRLGYKKVGGTSRFFFT